MKSLRVTPIMAAAVLIGLALGAAARASTNDLLARLRAETGGSASISYHGKTGRVRFIGTEAGFAIPRTAGCAPGAAAEEAARAFLAVYGGLFGVADQERELLLVRSSPSSSGRSVVRFQQVFHGVPVMGAEMVVQLDADRDVLSANGEVLPGLSLDVEPRVDAATAADSARAAVAKWYALDPADLAASEPELWIYNPIILGRNADRDFLVWRLRVRPVPPLPIDELVLVDARAGFVALHFNQVPSARNRRIYDNENNTAYDLPGHGPFRTEGQGPVADRADVNAAYDYAGHTYDFYLSQHGRDSLDGAGMDLVSTVRYCETTDACPYANAFWDGEQMVYGESYAAADDVVGHEMTHGVTDHASRLFYYMQSGAINESLSDIWGEFIDLGNGTGTDTPAVRWLLGEDLPIGAVRSMSNPPDYGQPDRMGSGLYYCGESDNGGVHYNSGVGNQAAFLMVDGGSFNGYLVSPLSGGIASVADLFYEVQTNHLTSASDYADLYDSLQQAAVAIGLPAADRPEVQDACDAVEMDQQPASCPADEAPFCDLGGPTQLFFDNMETPSSGNWTSGALAGSNAWYYPQNSNPYGFDATYATSGVYNIWGYDRSTLSDSYFAMTSNVHLPPNAFLHFNHAYAFEDYYADTYDGGVLEYSVNGGASWNDTAALFTDNGYTGTIYSGEGNPLAGRQAFCGESNGYISSRLDLSSLAGQNIRFRFRIGTDTLGGAYGWFIDDVRIFTCYAPVATPSPAATPVATPTCLPLIIDSGDYNGDGTADPAVFRPNSGMWAVRNFTNLYFGASSDFPAPGDYDADGTTDAAVFRPSQGLWGIRNISRVYFGIAGDQPIPGDYNGDGRTEIGVFRSAKSQWAIFNLTRWYFGSSTDRPAPGDYDGDGTADLALFRKAAGMWAINKITRVYFGGEGDLPVSADYNGEGRTECAVYRPQFGLWLVRDYTRLCFGGNTYLPLPGDYDGNGGDDPGAFRPLTGLWTLPGLTRTFFGTAGDIPVTR
jgi:Zn-dependent metalloprotease